MYCELEEYFREIEGKTAHDPLCGADFGGSNGKCVIVPCPLIIGAGPSGLAAAACLKAKGVPSLVLERSNCIASLWQLHTYDRLKLHLPKEFCELPLMSFPSDFPKYPTKDQFIRYLEAYVARFEIQPVFNRSVVRTEFDQNLGLWRVTVEAETGAETEYLCRWVVVATGENAEEVVPEIEGMEEFEGSVVHSCRYKTGGVYEGKKVLVVGCGNSGMEVCLDLCNHNANPSLVVRSTVHILPRGMFGISTFGLSTWLLKWFSVGLVDRFLLAISQLTLGDTSRFGLNRPVLGPLERKNLTGKTPVLDVGTFDKIISGDIKVRPDIKRLRQQSVEFVDGTSEDFDVIILATGYKSNVPSWLKESKMFSEENGLPKSSSQNVWKGENGLYAVGFTKRGLLGASMDAKNIAEDIAVCWREEARHFSSISWTNSLQKYYNKFD